MYTISCFLHLQNKESEPSDEVLSDGLLLANTSEKNNLSDVFKLKSVTIYHVWFVMKIF